ncbi:MAG: DUF3617 domain-containing protein [Alphaproteobacteria bacterium]|nr:DUF3617 domain-containing protein [Alphaproteobacteria bacterium]
MTTPTRFWLAVAATILAPGAALAAHGKAGLWEITSTTSGMSAQLPPEVQARMKAHGIQMPASNTFTVQHCMTAEEVAMDKPPPMGRGAQSCKVQNMKIAGQSVSADMVCNGERMQGTGHFAMTYDAPEHYAGKMSFNMNANGHPMAMTSTMEGRWIAASCGAVKH